MPFLDDGFFHALQQDPQDDALRLVYSDFLEDQGDEPSLAHAELIRVQVKLAALSPLTQHADEQAAELTNRQNTLLAKWQRVWLGDWAEMLHGWTFCRGFVEAVHADASVFLAHAADWFAQWPTLSVAKLTRAGGYLPEIAVSPWLAHLRGLGLSNNGIDSETLAQLTTSRYICLLQALNLSDNPIGPRGAALLASAKSAGELSEVHLARCGLWNEGLVTLLHNKASSSGLWRRLDLSGNGLNRLALVRLVEAPLMQDLEALDLADNPLGDNGASVLADSPNAAGLVDLGLCGTDTGDREVSALANSGNLPRLRSLDLRGHRCFWQRDSHGHDVGGIADLARSTLLWQLRRLLLAQRGPSNGWTAQLLRTVRPSVRLNLARERWIENLLRTSRYLIPSQLVECDLEELWWLGDTRNRERSPSDFYWVYDMLSGFPELLDQMEKSQATVLRLRYGLDEDPRTLAQISERLGLPREQVREIESQALAKLGKLHNTLLQGWKFG